MRYRLRRTFLVGVALATIVATSTNSADASKSWRKPRGATHHATGDKHRVKKKKKRGAASHGWVGPRGAIGPAGPPGPAGPIGPAGPVGSARAYGLVIGRAIPSVSAGSPGPSPYLHNATIQAGTSGGSPGVYCVAVSAGATTSNMVVVVSGAELPTTAAQSSGEVVLPYVTWLTGAPDCSNGQLEIRSFTYVTNAGSLVMSPSDLVSFSFVVA